MIGGEKDVVDALQPLFETMGKTIVHQGPAGAGQHTKMVNQILIASNMIGVCEGLLYGFKAGLDLNVVLESVCSGAAGLLEPEQPRPADDRRQLRAGLLRRALPQGHGHRAGRSPADEARLPGLALAEQLYRAVEAQGYARKGTHALMLALAQLSAIDWNARPK